MIGTRYLQALWIITFTDAALRLSCGPGEEFKSRNLTCEVNLTQGPFIWGKGDTDISSCSSSSPSCYTNNNSYGASLMGQTYTLNIINVIRENEGSYSCSDSQSNTGTCDFRVYVRPESVSCQKPELQTDMVKVMCTATRIYPSPICQFSWFINGTETSLAQDVTYLNMSAQGQPEYFFPTCILSLPAQNLGLGSHEFRVRAYPNVTGSPRDTDYGRDSSLTPQVTINYPTVQLESCPPGYVLEGSPASCSCRETANTFLPASTSFSQGSTVQSSGHGFTTYNFTASRSMGGLTCQAKLLGLTSAPVNYTPQVAYGPSNVSVKVMYNLTETDDVIDLCGKSQPVTVTCTVSVGSVSPGADYEFNINGSRMPADPVTSSSLTYIVTNGGPLSVQCTGNNSAFKGVTATSPARVFRVTVPPAAPPIIDKNQDSGSLVAGTEGHLTVQEGINRIRCRVEGGYPSVSRLSVGCGTLTNTSVGNVAFLDVNVSRYMDASECSCNANHSSPCYRNNKIVTKLDVLFEPTVVSFTVNEGTVLQEIIIERNSDVRFSCQAEGNPSPRLSLSKDGVQLVDYSDHSQKFNLSLKFNKTKTDCRDAGLYSCQALTGQTGVNKTVGVNVQCPQQLENPAIQDKVYKTRFNGTIDISIPVFGYPEPSLNLSSENILNKEAYNLTYTNQRPSYGIVSLHIYTVTATVFQNYSINITNSQGTLVYNFQIQEGDPATPSGDGLDVAAIVGGIFAGIVVIVLVILIVFFLKKKGCCRKEPKDDPTTSLHNLTEKDDTVEFDNYALYGSGKPDEVVTDNSAIYNLDQKAVEAGEVVTDNSAIYNLDQKDDEVVIDNSDLYNFGRKNNEVVTDNYALYYMGQAQPGKTGQDSMCRSYSDIVPTMTTATTVPKNITLNRTQVTSSPYEDVVIESTSGNSGMKQPGMALKPKPMPKPKPEVGQGSALQKNKTAQGNQIYATVIKVPKSNTPFVVSKERSPSPPPEIPDKNFDKTDKDSINNKKKDSSSFAYSNAGFNDLEDDKNVYSNTNI